MNKWVKRGLWTVGVVVVLFLGVGAIGYSMMTNAEDFAKENGIQNPIAVDAKDSILCTDGKVGIAIVDGYDVNATAYPVCADIFGDVKVGAWK